MPLSIYKSSAGSGKTYTLAKEYLKLLLKNPYQHKHILAVTFTNKATQEMKERIIKFLIALKDQKDQSLLEQIARETNYSEKHIQGNAQKALQHILHNYGDFTVVTIDSFFNSIIKAFAHEVKLPLNMEVQLNTDEALNEAYDKMMDKLSIDEQLVEYMSQFMFQKIEDDKGWNIENEIKKLGKELFKESFDSVFESLDNFDLTEMQSLIDELRKQQNEIKQKYQTWADEWQKIMEGHDLEIEDFSHGKAGVGNFVRHFADFRFDKFDEPGKRAEAALNDLDKWHTKSSKRADEIKICVNNGLYKILNDGLEYWKEVRSDFYTRKILLKNLHALGLLKTINDYLKTFRDEHDQILISDQNRIIHKIISQSEVSFLFEKTGSKYRHFLLDEFQDTSALQWLNFQPLLENALAEDGQVLIVGDAKQSIYRWRGGKMELLLTAVEDGLSQHSSHSQVLNLAENYRSRKEIIEFNNSFFANIADSTKYVKGLEASSLAQLAFQDVQQKLTSNTQDGGYVSMEFLGNTKELSQDVKKEIDGKLISQIFKLKKEGYTWRDMACMVFSNKQGSRAAKLLESKGIPVQSNESLLVSNATAVKLITSLLKLIQNPHDPLIRGEVTLLLWQLDLLDNEEKSIHPLLFKAKNSLVSFDELLPTTLKGAHKIRHHQLLQLVHLLLEKSGLHQSQSPYLLRFLELVYQFEEKQESSLSEFLRWWDDHKDSESIQVPGQKDAVIIITIHKAKGLQFPVVLMPYCTRKVLPMQESVFWWKNENIDRDWLEFLPLTHQKKLTCTPYKPQYLLELEQSLVDILNMLYVAFTRPEERLYVFADLCGRQIDSAQILFKHLGDHAKLKPYFKDQKLEFGSAKSPEKKVAKSIAENHGRIISAAHEFPALHRPKFRIADLEGFRGNAINKGVVLHELLSQISSEKQVDKTLFMASQKGLIETKDQQQWRQEIMRILQLPEVSYWHSQAIHILNEQEILSRDGSLRPDKIFILPNSVVLLDYKTGQQSAEHHKQVKGYVNAIKELSTNNSYFQGKSIEAFLLYTQEAKLQKVAS